MASSSTMSEEEHVNPAVPKTVGALLTEEVTMDPLSPLPSFLEMKMMEEATASAQRAVTLCLERMLQRTTQVRRPLWRVRIARLVTYIAKTYGTELRMVVTYLVNRKCLRSNACATIAESLYGARRAKLGPVAGENGQRSVLPLDDKDETRLALLLALGPYIQERSEKLYQRLKLQEIHTDAACDRSSVWVKLKAAFVAAYPYLHATKEGTLIIYQWLFLLGRTLHFDPISHLLGQVVRRTTHADLSESKHGEGRTGTAEPSSTSPEALRMDLIRKAVLVGLSSTFVLGWMRQFRNLIRAQTQQHQSSIETIPPPRPLPVKLDPKTRIRPPSLTNSSLCPLCRQTRINPAAATSGYVFCHRCIVMFVREHGKCPITGTACPESRIVRVYEPTNMTL